MRPRPRPSRRRNLDVVEAWRRLPAVLRALVAGAFVGMIGLLATGYLFDANDRVWKDVPWSALAVIVFFWLYVEYFRGRWWPRATAEGRRRAMSWNNLTARQWRYAAFAGVAAFVYVPASVAVSFRFMSLTPDLLDRSAEIEGMPMWVAMSYIIALSVSAGVWEEAAFRGYFQNIVARRHGHRLAILASAVLFTIAHFNHESGPARAAMLLTGGVMVGYLCHAAGSIVPAALVHILSDIHTGMMSRGILDPRFVIKLTPVWETGVDGHLIAWSLVTVVSVLAFGLAARKLAREGRTRCPRSLGSEGSGTVG